MFKGGRINNGNKYIDNYLDGVFKSTGRIWKDKTHRIYRARHKRNTDKEKEVV